ncbi:MAG: DEAD/DEAH box helicase family protein, partial [Erysipelotrichaceae bacterium]|nr:DEAD/DEAH box helicase family protein [Erysipelotrichaceae bacterium]
MEYKPHEYQRFATQHILDHPEAAVLLDCGMGKSVITLQAIFDLCLDSFEIQKVLIVAPLRVARDSWPAEIEKWDELKGLTYSVVTGTEKQRRQALAKRSTIYIINRENLDWLIRKSNIPFTFDMIVLDELSSFKSHQTNRFKALMSVRPRVKRIVGLTGTPASNSLIDLWAEFKLLDMGKRLGRYITRYREEYFVP